MPIMLNNASAHVFFVSRSRWLNTEIRISVFAIFDIPISVINLAFNAKTPKSGSRCFMIEVCISVIVNTWKPRKSLKAKKYKRHHINWWNLEFDDGRPNPASWWELRVRWRHTEIRILVFYYWSRDYNGSESGKTNEKLWNLMKNQSQWQNTRNLDFGVS